VCPRNYRSDVKCLRPCSFDMGRQQGFQALPRTIHKERGFLTGDLQDRRTEGHQKAISVAGAKTRPSVTRHEDDSLMSVLPARIAQWPGPRRLVVNIR